MFCVGDLPGEWAGAHLPGVSGGDDPGQPETGHQSAREPLSGTGLPTTLPEMAENQTEH